MAAAVYDLPVALVLVVGGALSCFAGYRLFRSVLAIYGFVVGWSLAGTVITVHNTFGSVVVGLIGGVLGAVALVFAYFIAVGLIGAGLGAVVAHVGWGLANTTEPPRMLIVA